MVIEIPDGSVLRAHCWVAINDYIRQLRCDGRSVPTELTDLQAKLDPRVRYETADPRARVLELGRERVRRHRARERGELVPLRRPGLQPRSLQTCPLADPACTLTINAAAVSARPGTTFQD